MLTQLPPEILTMICSFLPLQDVKNVAQILPEIFLTIVFKNWSKLQNTLNNIQTQINLIKSNNHLKHLYHENCVSEQFFTHLQGNISPKKLFLHIMVTDQHWFESSSPFYVKKTLNYMLTFLNDVKKYYDIVNN